MSEVLLHETIVISRTIKASAKAVFSAWEDPQARSIWGPPSSDEALEFLESDFRIGGCDVHHCGQKGDLRFRVETRYYCISNPQRLIFTERVTTDEKLLSTSLVSVSFDGDGDTTKLDVTIQIASLAT